MVHRIYARSPVASHHSSHAIIHQKLCHIEFPSIQLKSYCKIPYV